MTVLSPEIDAIRYGANTGRSDDCFTQRWQSQREGRLENIENSGRLCLSDRIESPWADLCSGQVNVNVGYGHPKIVSALVEQLKKVAYVAPVFGTEARSRLAEMVADRTPGDLNWVFFCNSGSEAVENAIKIARAVTGRAKIYSAWPSYHGATAGASSISGDPRRHYVEPGLAGVRNFLAPTCSSCPFGQSAPPACGFACVESLRNQISLDGPETVAAIVLEPVSGTSGLHRWPQHFVGSLRRLCSQHGILLIFDETMCGWGRTGKWFACEHYGVVPDILTTAKGITSGYVPLGVTVVTSAIREAFLDRPFVGGLTNEGHALACAAGIANIDVYEEEALIERSDQLGRDLGVSLRALKDRHDSVSDVRCCGLFGCIELRYDDGTPGAAGSGKADPAQTSAAMLAHRLFEEGLPVKILYR